MQKTKSIKYFQYVIIFLAFAFGLILQGNIPGLSLATLGQTIAVAGYPISFIDSGTLYANHMGYPTPTPMSTLLAPALLMVVANIVGIDPINSYIFAFIVFYSFGFYGAYQLSKTIKVSSINASLLSLLWMSFPIVWNSSGYSHLHFAFVLYPFLMYVVISKVVYVNDWQGVIIKDKIILFLLPTLIIFTDGYTFMFYAVSASVIIFNEICIRWQRIIKQYGELQILLVHFFSLLIAYLIYSKYIGVTSYAASPIDFHRGWGVDIIYLLLPTHGVHYIWDVFGLSQLRDAAVHYGDASVWISSFMLPLIVLAVILFRKVKIRLKWLALFMFVISIYMALGPSLKINATRIAGESQMMMANQASFATGNSILYENVPGFKSMRATFRWVLVSFFSLWLFILAFIASKKSPKNSMLLLFLMILFIPNIKNHINTKINNYNSYSKIKMDLIAPLGESLKPNQIIAFLPYRNDFMVNYIAPYLDIYTYNIGGDKNLEIAKSDWPDELRKFKMGQFHTYFAEDILMLLLSEKNIVDAVVIPHIDLLWAAHRWPLGEKEIDKARRIKAVESINKFGALNVEKLEYFTIIRLQSHLTRQDKQKIRSEVVSKFCYENCYAINKFNLFNSTQNGTSKNGWLASSGKRGFLHFGPYEKFGVGEYILNIEILNCQIESDAAFIDVVSKKGHQTHFRKNITKSGSCNFKGEIKLEHPVEDLEVRVFSDNNDIIVLKSIRLVPKKEI